MTRIYLVRHAQPDYTHICDRTRPLTREGEKDAELVLAFFREKQIDAVYTSPYRRSVDTVSPTAAYHHKRVITDHRFREREKGPGGNRIREMYYKRWNDFSYHEPGGECLLSVQRRNIRALGELLRLYKDKSVIVGTHGTALSTILHHYDKSFGCEDFLRIIDFMPYILELQFEGEVLAGRVEHLAFYKEYHPKKEKHPAIGRVVTVTVDRAMGSVHPQYKDMVYPINYGYVPGIIAPDGEEQDAYLLGVDVPVRQMKGRVIAVIHRRDDAEEKWVVCPEGMQFQLQEIKEKTWFCERYFDSEIMM